MSQPETTFFFVVLPLLAVWLLSSRVGRFRPPAEIGREGNPPDQDRYPRAHPPPIPPNRSLPAGVHPMDPLAAREADVRKLEVLCSAQLRVGDLVELDDHRLQYFSVYHPSAKFWMNPRYEGHMGLVLDIKPNRGSVYNSPGVLVSIWGGKPTWHSPALWKVVCRPEDP